MALFDGVVFHLSPSIPAERSAELKHVLLENGAVQAKSIHLATHIITDTNKFEGCQDVDPRVSVVTDMWVERSIILDKVQTPSHYSADPAMIFSGVVASATELSSSDVEVLSAGITALGGQWRTALTRDVTHLFCVSDTSPKYDTAMHFKEQTHVHVLLPHWFDDSVRLGCRNLPAKEYEWPDPGCLRSLTASQQDGVKENERAHHTLTPEKKARLRYSGHMTNEPLPTGHSTNIWDGRRILLSMSLELPPSRRTAIESGIARCGGIIVPYMTNGGEGTKVEETQNVGKCDILVTKWRSGRVYVKAVRENKTIGTLGWVFYVHATGIVSRPMDQLLHYPIPKKLIEKFSNHEITVTNYTGEAREYLKKLITTMGATFTPSMSGRNTVLIAAYLSGTKTTKAAAWSIPIVNHTWIEDCFIKWRNLTVGVEKYIYFPPGMDFAKLLGERGVGSGFTVSGGAEVDGDHDGDIGAGGWVALESEEELEALEKEDDVFDAELNGMDDEGSVGGEVDRPLVIGQSSSPLKKRDMNGIGSDTHRMEVDLLDFPLSATGSADAREVEAAVNPWREDDEMIKHSPKGKKDKEKKPQQSRGKLQNKGKGASEDEKTVETVKPSSPIKGKEAKPEGSKKHVAEAVDITKPSSSRQNKAADAQDDESDDMGKTSGRHGSRLRRGKTLKKDDVTKKGKGKAKAVDLELSEESDGGSGHDRIVAKSTPNKVPDSVGRKSDVGRARESDNSDETEEDDDLILDLTRKSSSGGKKAVRRKSKIKEVIRLEEEESEDDDVPVKRSTTQSKPVTVKIETSKMPNSSVKKEADGKGKRKQTVQDAEEEESDEKEENDISRTRSGKTRRKPLAHDMDVDEVEVITPKRKPAGPSKSALESSPLSPPPPDSSAAVRTSKRSAALKASQRLHDEIMPDMNQYQSALKKGRISLGAVQKQLLKAADRRPTSSITGRKRKSNESSDEEEEELEIKKKPRVSFDSAAMERQKIDDVTKDKIKVERNVVLLTTQVSLTDDVSKALVRLGVKMTTHATECTHLIAPRIVRTEKFLCAMASGPFVLSEEWAKRSAAAKKLLPEKNYLLRDEAGEEKFSLKLKDAIERAKGGKIFAGKTFYVTPKVQTDMQLLKNVIIACGAQFSATTPTTRMLSANANRHIISCPEEVSVWRPIAAHHPIYNQEFILSGALRQLAEWDNHAFRVPGSF